jgi:hypothetical protein
MGFEPTTEQRDAVETFNTGQNMVLEAGAGTGKTSTLKLMANADESLRGTYVAYNKPIAQEAARDFPRSVRCVTAHSLAYRAIVAEWGDKLQARLNAPRRAPYDTVRMLGAEKLVLGEGRILAPHHVSRIAMETVRNFCYSADEVPTAKHVGQVNGADGPQERAVLCAAIVPLAYKAWLDISRPDGVLAFSHDNYLKLWGMTHPKLEGDFVLLDEAQDANPLTAAIFNDQTHMQRVAVGDSCQSIYGWRGATDALSTMDTDARLYLSQSFRFGPAVADEANKWLGLLNAPLRLRGASFIDSKVGEYPKPHAVLTRTNAQAVSSLMKFLAEGVQAALVGGGAEIRKLAEAANQLRETGKTSHPELCAFTSWGQVQDYCEQDAAGGDLKVAVTLIDDYGAGQIISAIENSASEDRAEVVISTAHKSKGREWSSVRIADDFRPPKPDELTDRMPLPSREDMMLAYVAVTRAQHCLDRSGLSWVDNYLGGGPWAQPNTLGRALYREGRRLGLIPTNHELAQETG